MDEIDKRRWHEKHERELRERCRKKHEMPVIDTQCEVATREEIAQFYTGIINNPQIDVNLRLSAADKLTRLQGYIRDKEQTSPQDELARIMSQVVTSAAAPQWQQHLQGNK